MRSLEGNFESAHEGTLEQEPETNESEKLSLDEAVLYQHVATTGDGIEFSERASAESETYAEAIINCFKENGFEVSEDVVRKVAESTDLEEITKTLKEYIVEMGGDASSLEEVTLFTSAPEEDTAESKSVAGKESGLPILKTSLFAVKSLVAAAAIAIAAANPGSAFARNLGHHDTGDGIKKERVENVEGRLYKSGESYETDHFPPVDLSMEIGRIQEKHKEQFEEIMRINPRIKSITIEPTSQATYGFMETISQSNGTDAGMTRAIVVKIKIGVEGKNGKGVLYEDMSYHKLLIGGTIMNDPSGTIDSVSRKAMSVIGDNVVHGHNSIGLEAQKRMGRSAGVQNLADESIQRIIQRINDDWSSVKDRNDQGKVEYFKPTE